MSRNIMNRFRIGPVSITLLAALTAASFEAHAQDSTSAPAPSAVSPDPAATKTEAPKADNPTEPKEVKQAGAPDTKADAKAERITVTGSRIKQIELEGPKPIVTVGAEEIKKSGATNVNEYLSKLTVASFGTSSYGSSYGATEGTQGFNIRGLGEENTLVLLNGRRLVRDPSLEIIDLSIIPVAAVERIEILKGTASAIYGTDAAAGVVNIITRKDYKGTAFGYSKYKNRFLGGGDHDQAYVVAGTSSEDSTNILTFQWDQQAASTFGKRPWIDRSYRSSYGAPFSYFNANNKLIPGGPCANTKSLGGGNSVCSSNYIDEYEYIAPSEKISMLDDYTYNLAKNTKLNLRLFATKKNSHTHGLREVLDQGTDHSYYVSRAFIDASHPEIAGTAVAPKYEADPAHNGADGVAVRGRLLGAPGSETETEQLTYAGTTSVTHEFDNGDSLDLSFSESRIERHHVWKNMFDSYRLGDAIFKGTVDVFAATPPSNLDQYRQDVPDLDMSEARTTELDYTGSFDLGSKNFGYAVGLSQIHENYFNHTSPSNLFKQINNLGGGSAQGDRKANAVFGEIKVPIVSTLEATVAARFDDYTDFGSTTNPALGLQYRAGKDWLMRANYGTGFKAPSLRQVHDAPATFFTGAIDHKLCNAANASGDAGNIAKYCDQEAQGSITQGGNSDLRPEKSQNVNAFVGYEPVIGYGVSLEYYASKIKDQIGNVTAEDLTKLEGNGVPLPVGTQIVRNATSGDITRFISPTTNLGSVKTSGLETSVYAKQPFSFGTLSYRTNYSYVLTYLKQALPQGDFSNKLEQYGPRWLWNNTFGYGIGIHEIALINRASGQREKTNLVSYGKVGAYNQWDLNYAVDITKAATLNVGGENIFNQQPSIDPSALLTRGGGSDMIYYMKADFRI
ncbi:MAG: TonB-dependent receptor [Chitinophagaceae bacterium]|nr:TonB-dependent receptor [Oligoflexus sp.]